MLVSNRKELQFSTLGGKLMSESEELLKTGRELLDKGNLKKAFSTFNKVVKADPENADGYFGKAEAAVGLPKHSIIDVAGFYREAIKRDTENGYFYLTYAEFCLSNGLLKQAEENYTKAIELDPDNSVFYYNDLAYGYYNNGILFLDRQLDMSREDVVTTSLKYLFKAFNLDDTTATKMLNELTETKIIELVKPIRTKESDEKTKLENFKDKDEFEKMIKAEPKNPYCYLTFGQFCFFNGLLNLGETNFLTAIKLDPENRSSYYNDLAPNYYSCGLENYGNDLKEPIIKNSLRYALHSIELTPANAIQYLNK